MERMVTIDIESSPAITNLKIITITGTIDMGTSKHVDEKILPVIEKEESNIILDLSKLDYLSSVGMMSLTKYLVLLRDKNRLLKIVRPPNPVHGTLEAFGFTKRFDIYDSVEAAIDTLR